MIDVKKLKQLRIEKRRSQFELAEMAGISQTQISKIELGLSDTTTDVLVAIAKALDVPPNELLTDEPKASNPTQSPAAENRQGTAATA